MRSRSAISAIHSGRPPHSAVPRFERALTLAEVQEMQTRLTKAGFDTGGPDRPRGNDNHEGNPGLQAKMGTNACRRLCG